MRVVMTLVSDRTFRDKAVNPNRVRWAADVLEQAGRLKADLAVFPAGYLMARGDDSVAGTAEPILEVARGAGVAVVMGVDTAKARTLDGSKSDLEGLTRRGRLPCFGIGWSPAGAGAGPWRQRSWSADNAREEGAGEERMLSVAGGRVEVLLCGELHSEPIRAAVRERRPDAVVVLGHRRMKSQVGPTMRKISAAPTDVLLTHHLKHQGRFQRWCSGANRGTYDATNARGEGDDWIAWVLFEDVGRA